MIFYKKISIFFIIIMILLVLTAGCSVPKKWINTPDINQGNYLTSRNTLNLRIGMKQKEVISLLGTPLMTDLFGNNIWFYVFRYPVSHKKIIQKMLILTFNKKGILISIINQS